MSSRFSFGGCVAAVLVGVGCAPADPQATTVSPSSLPDERYTPQDSGADMVMKEDKRRSGTPSPEASPDPGAALPIATYDPRTDMQGNAITASARLTGTLNLSGRCLIISSAEGSVAIAFPTGGASWDASAKRLTFKGRTHGLGEQASLGGGFADAVAEPAVKALSNDCPAGKVWKAG